ncbi:hypothetical protein CBOM_06642 [Ceraceosorus bombacis]|uniref:Uncharacterized protein n=1 Tax=Ceraceosorus bombacis TaxID=401625 RepID=A0A0P1BSU6_9BASI|nr:hypothetical protein CBOM_06642 [Ceraceosorus bombacis]
MHGRGVARHATRPSSIAASACRSVVPARKKISWAAGPRGSSMPVHIYYIAR